MPTLLKPDVDRALAFRIFAEAIDLAGDARRRFLEERCGAEPALRAEVEAYLASAAADPLGTRSLAGPAPRVVESLVGRQVGRFRLVERVGEGGMGVVYRAERTDGVQQTVAIKLVASTLDEVARQRFEREAQLLARLEHPAVARLIDAGIDEERAWIAIEFVRGERIDRYCAARDLPPREIVRLLVQLADALAAAHAMLVVHSDIKPANVLVTSDGVPKLIDFGIATALRDSDAQDSPTLHAGRLFSPHYAAAEQIQGEPITVATDVFGLGALAYRLLTGCLAYRDAPTAVAYLLAVTHRDIELPSAAAAAAGRGAAIGRQLRGDLDAILGKALEREPARRYASAAEMGADLRAYLERRPVAAGAASPLYRLGKFVRRNVLAVSLSSMLVASLLGGGLFASLQAHRAALARDEARTVTAFLENDILAAANPMVAGTRDVPLRPLLDGAAKTLQQRFAGQPGVLAELQAAMGSGYAALFDTPQAEALLTAAEAGLARERGDSDPETQSARMALWYLYTGNVDLPKLYQLSKRIAAAEEAAGRRDSALDYRARMMLAMIPCVARAPVFNGLSDCAGVMRPFYTGALAQFGPDALATHEMAWFLGVSLVYSSREDEAVPVLRSACAGLEHYYGPIHHRLTACRRFLAMALDGNGQSAEAEPLFAAALRNFTTTLGPDSRFATITDLELATAAVHAGHPAQGVSAAREAVRGMQLPACQCDDDLWRAEAWLAEALVAAGQTDEGLALGEQTLATAIAAAGAGAGAVLGVRAIVAEAALRAGRLARAEALARDNLARGGALANRPAWLAGELQSALARALIAGHRHGEARALLAEAVPVLDRELGAGNRRTRVATAAWQEVRAD
jgi:serine/threonine-protein kinase